MVNESAPNELERYTAEYETLFLDNLVPVVFGNTRSISYAPSSTSNGWQSLNFSNSVPIVERDYNLTQGSVYGETDFYNYDPSVLGNDSAYPVGRFSNEFGFHSMPSIQSWRQQVSEEYLSFNSSVVMLRDHHPPPGGLSTSNYANASIGQYQMTQVRFMVFETVKYVLTSLIAGRRAMVSDPEQDRFDCQFLVVVPRYAALPSGPLCQPD